MKFVIALLAVLAANVQARGGVRNLLGKRHDEGKDDRALRTSKAKAQFVSLDKNGEAPGKTALNSEDCDANAQLNYYETEMRADDNLPTVYKALAVDGNRGGLDFLFPEVYHASENGDYCTPWPFLRVSKSKDEAVFFRAKALRQGDADQGHPDTAVVKIDLNKYNEEKGGKNGFPRLTIGLVGGGYHIIVAGEWKSVKTSHAEGQTQNFYVPFDYFEGAVLKNSNIDREFRRAERDGRSVEAARVTKRTDTATKETIRVGGASVSEDEEG